MKKILILVILVALIGAIAFSGCLQTGTGLLVLKISDKPGDLNITRANLTISQIRVHLGASDVNDSNVTGWYTVVNKSQIFDLMTLQNNVTEELGIVNLSPGLYTQIRLYIEKAVLTIDGVEYDCKIPSNTIKLITPFQISADNTTTITLDFDIWESVHETGNGNYTFKPTIKIIQG
ncbi:MAG: DUF4382 domain-containing protein [Candidatus Thermoplasmatota archaeon]|nr:DUF4382 domain-containing protein [Candidatus Thermoplasmatota archaeon]